MDHAQVLIIEDDDCIRDLAKFHIELAGHKVVGEATTIEEANELIEQIGNNALKADVAVLDGNLNPPTTDAADARHISRELRRVCPAMYIIGLSAQPLDSGIVDYDLGKVRFGKHLESLSNIINDLPGPVAGEQP